MKRPSRRAWLRIGLAGMLAAALYPPWDFFLKTEFVPVDLPSQTDSAEVKRYAALWSPPRVYSTSTNSDLHELITTTSSRPRIDFGTLVVTWVVVALGTALLATFGSSGDSGTKHEARTSRHPPEPQDLALRG